MLPPTLVISKIQPEEKQAYVIDPSIEVRLNSRNRFQYSVTFEMFEQLNNEDIGWIAKAICETEFPKSEGINESIPSCLKP